MKLIKRLVKEEKGQGYVEYVVLLGLIALVAWIGVEALGTNVLALFQEVAAGVAGL